MEAQELKAEISSQLIDQENVSGVGIGKDEDGNDVVVINVAKGEADSVAIPSGYEDENIEIRETGVFMSEQLRLGEQDPEAIDRKAEQRPVPGGVSAAHNAVTAGTTGFILQDADGNRYPSSNNHVYANVNQASQGDAIYQPGPADGGSSANTSGDLEGWLPIEDGALLDIAWINPVVQHELNFAELGTPKGTPTGVEVGDTLIKSGRTTGVSEADVTQKSADVNVNYGDNSYRIEDTIITNAMSQGGDSGSATLKKSSMEPAGILFAGSDSATVHGKATHVEPETGLTIVTESSDQPPVAVATIALNAVTVDSGDIRVTVEDPSGSAVDSATVTITGPSEKSAKTDVNGFVSFTGVDIGEWNISANKDGFGESSTTVTSDDFN